MAEIFLFTRGMVLGVLLLLCLKLWLEHRQLLAGRLLLALLLGVSCYTVLPFLKASPWLVHIVVIPAILIPALFWLFSLALFQDWDNSKHTIGTARLTLILVYFIVDYAGYWLAPAELESGASAVTLTVVVLSYVFRVVFMFLALAVILAEWQQDLVEARRHLRRMFAAVGGGYILVVICVEMILGFSPAPLWLEVGHSLMLLVLFTAIAIWLMIHSPDGLSSSLGLGAGPPTGTIPPAPAADAATLSVTEQGWMNALQQQMEGESAYHDSTLTIRKLAEQLTIPEHQLRRLINRHLGYRNFNDYLNHYRISEAAQCLADPAQERLPILTIALEVGYASLTPFNRAFKARYQQTPSEFRRGLAFDSPADSE
jgi:AraC-like DNA-binding protein